MFAKHRPPVVVLFIEVRLRKVRLSHRVEVTRQLGPPSAQRKSSWKRRSMWPLWCPLLMIVATFSANWFVKSGCVTTETETGVVENSLWNRDDFSGATRRGNGGMGRVRSEMERRAVFVDGTACGEARVDTTEAARPGSVSEGRRKRRSRSALPGV